MKSPFLHWGSISGFIGGVIICLVGLLVYSSITSEDSEKFHGTHLSEGAITDPGSLDSLQSRDISNTADLIRRRLELVRFFETATFEQILQLLNQSEALTENFNTWYIQEGLVKQLASMDPQATLDSVQRMRSPRKLELISTLYSVWAEEDPGEAMRSAAQQVQYLQLDIFRAILATLTIPLSSDLRELAESLDIRVLVDKAINEIAIRDLTQTNPQAAFELIFADDVDNVRQEVLLSEIIEHWTSGNDDEALKQLLTSFRDEYSKIGLFDARSNRLFLNLLTQIMQTGPYEIWQLNLNHPSDFQDSLNSHILQVWVGLDPRAAKEALSELEGTELFDDSYRTVWTEWAEIVPLDALQNISLVQPELRELVIASAVKSLVRTDRVEQALSSIVRLKESGENIGLSVHWLTHTWLEYDVTATADWLIATDTINDTLRKRLMRTVLPELAHADPLRAYQRAVEYEDPAPFDYRFTLGNLVIESVAQAGDLESALALLQKVDEDALVAAFSKIGLSYIAIGKIDEAIALGAELATPDQPEYFEYLTIQWFQQRPDELFDNLANLPTVDSQRAVAAILLDDRLRYRGEMSPEEVSTLESLVFENNLD